MAVPIPGIGCYRFFSTIERKATVLNGIRAAIMITDVAVLCFHSCKQGSLTEGKGSVQLTSLLLII
jgi:hypothetical protein